MMKRPFNDHVNALAAYMPDGDLFAAKHIADSNFRQLLRGITYELFDAQGYLCDLEEQYFPDATESFLSEWEQALGIPDDCFSGTGDVLERRRDIVVKLAALGIQTAEDFRQLAEVFGEVVAVIPGSEYTNYPLPVPADDQKRYYIIIEFTPATGGFPYTFPFTFGSDAIRILECLFVSLAPANCRVLFRAEAPPVPPATLTAVIALLGQSNMVGRHGPITSPVDDPQANILQYSAGALVAATNPLDNFDETPDTVGPGLSMAKKFLLDNPSYVRVILVPAADGGTGYLARNWNRTDALYTDAVDRVNAAVSLAQAAYGAPDVELTAILDIQGEDDLDGNEGLAATDEEIRTWKSANYQAMRRDITIATASTPVITGGIPPDWSGTGTANTAFAALSADVEKWAFADPTGLASELGDLIHYSAASARTMGGRLSDAIPVASASGTALVAAPTPPAGNFPFYMDATGMPDNYPLTNTGNVDFKWSNRRVYVSSGEYVMSTSEPRSRRIQFEDGAVSLEAPDFSIKIAVTPTSATSAFPQAFIGRWVAAGNARSWLFRRNNSDIEFFTSLNGSTLAASMTAASVLSAGVETELELRREAGTISIFVNGSGVASASMSDPGTFFDPAAAGSGVRVGDYNMLYDSGGGGRDFIGTMRYLSIELL